MKPLTIDGKVAERFWSKVRETPTCWLWIASLSCKGYGRLFVGGKARWAHRISWCMHYGTIPEGLWVLHSCDNPSCVRPEHLFIGTAKDNTIDSMKKGRFGFRYGEFNGRAKLTWLKVAEIRRSHSAKEFTYGELAKKNGVSAGEIGEIVRGHLWVER